MQYTEHARKSKVAVSEPLGGLEAACLLRDQANQVRPTLVHPKKSLDLRALALQTSLLLFLFLVFLQG